jgi:hypothetical protein
MPTLLNTTGNPTTSPHGLQLRKRSASVDLIMVLFCKFTTTELTCRWSCCMVDRKHDKSKWARSKKGGERPSIFLVEHVEGMKQTHFLTMRSKTNSNWLLLQKKTLIFTGWPATEFSETQECVALFPVFSCGHLFS